MKVGIFLNVILNHLTIADGVEENRGVYCPRRGRAPTIMKYRFFSLGSKIGPSGDNRMIFVFPDPANFSRSDGSRVDFPKIWESPEKTKSTLNHIFSFFDIYIF